METDFRVLLVCLGNICRSPTGEAALRLALDDAGLSDRVEVESAGTGAWHVGHAPDPRMVAAGTRRGLTLAGEARQVDLADFMTFDLILAMDRSNRDDLVALAPDVASGRKVRMLREFDPDADSEDVPDPYYGGDDGFLRVVDMVRTAAAGVVAHIEEQLGEEQLEE